MIQINGFYLKLNYFFKFIYKLKSAKIEAAMTIIKGIITIIVAILRVADNA